MFLLSHPPFLTLPLIFDHDLHLICAPQNKTRWGNLVVNVVADLVSVLSFKMELLSKSLRACKITMERSNRRSIWDTSARHQSRNRVKKFLWRRSAVQMLLSIRYSVKEDCDGLDMSSEWKVTGSQSNYCKVNFLMASETEDAHFWDWKTPVKEILNLLELWSGITCGEAWDKNTAYCMLLWEISPQCRSRIGSYNHERTFRKD